MSNKPVKTFRDGAIKVTVWGNENDKGTFYSFEAVQGYKDNNGEWKESKSFTGADALRASNLLTKAYNHTLDLKADA